MYDWHLVVQYAVWMGWISVECQAVLSATASFSDPTAKHVWSSQAAIGDRCDRSAGAVNAHLREARDAGLLEWVHTNEAVGPGLVVQTSNLYEFRFPLELVRAAKSSSPIVGIFLPSSVGSVGLDETAAAFAGGG